MQNGFVILDFGSQVSKLIARRYRELGYYSELLPYNTSLSEIGSRKPKGIILSGGPASVFDTGAPMVDVQSLFTIAPVMGICYGMQLLAHELGGVVESAAHREYGLMDVEWQVPIGGVAVKQTTWMSHGDVVKVPPTGFEIIARSENGHPAAMRGAKCLAFQFHPEVTHTVDGINLLKFFAESVCKAKPNWQSEDVLNKVMRELKNAIPDGQKVLCALSGGVDSTVVATLLTKALGSNKVHCVFVDTGLLRKNEFNEVLDIYKELGLAVKGVDASEYFYKELNGVEDPERKRKIIGHAFIDIFKREIKKDDSIHFLAQGTLYPDVIESVSPLGASVTIKSHHNVGGLPKDLGLKLIEPLRDLFKDEVRVMGKKLGIPDNILNRHPFPGPGLAIRIIGPVDRESLEILKSADAIYTEELKKNGLYHKIWQAFTVLLPIKTVGVQGDGRSYEQVLAIRAVTSQDGMTADWYGFDEKFMRKLSNRLTNEVKGINRVVYDVTSKPPGTIEWE
jgi:GMP synthase (glutamine-hydrolysing)